MYSPTTPISAMITPPSAQHDRDRGRPARFHAGVDKSLRMTVTNREHEAAHRNRPPEVGSKTQRFDGKCGNAVHPQGDQLFQAVAAFALRPLPVVDLYIGRAIDAL